MSLTETKLILDLDDGTQVQVSIWSEHEYQMEAVEEALQKAMSFRSCQIVGLDRVYEE